MKLGAFTDPEDGLVKEGWFADSVWQYHLRPDQLPAYQNELVRYIKRLLRIPVPARKRLKQVSIRCPAKGCLLATVYEFPMLTTAEDTAGRRDGGVRYLFVGRTPAGTELWELLNYACACNQVLYWRAGCRCGTATLCRSGMQELFWTADRICPPGRTEAEEIASLPKHVQRFWGKRVFHPDPEQWHAKRDQERLIKSRRIPDRTRAV